MQLTSNQQWVLNYLKGGDSEKFVSPTQIGNAKKNGYHSAWASPICKKLVELGLVERSDRGWYRAIKN